MRKLIVLVHTSLDGFVAGVNGELDGLETCEENLEAVCQLTKEADAAVFGRVSFELINSFWKNRKDHPDATWNELVYSCWFNRVNKYVVTTKRQAIDEVGIINTSPEVAIKKKKLKAEAGEKYSRFRQSNRNAASFKNKPG